MDANLVLIAAVLALSPLPILASVLLITSEHGRAKATALAAGWISALVVVAVATVLVGSQVSLASGGASTASAVLDIVLGVVAVGYAVVLLRRHETSQPGWLGRIDRMSPWVAFGLGAFIPPYVLVVAGANQILRTETTAGAQAVAGAVFVVLGSIGATAPLVASLVVRDPDAMLARWRSVLQSNWHRIAGWLLVVIGIYLVIKGIVEVTGG